MSFFSEQRCSPPPYPDPLNVFLYFLSSDGSADRQWLLMRSSFFLFSAMMPVQVPFPDSCGAPLTVEFGGDQGMVIFPGLSVVFPKVPPRVPAFFFPSYEAAVGQSFGGRLGMFQ